MSGTGPEFRYSAEDYVAAYQLQAAPTRRLLLYAVLMVLACATFFYFATDPDFALWSLGWLPVTVVVWYAIIWTVLVPWRARHTYARHPLAHMPIRLSLRPEGLHSEHPRGTSTLLWKDFIRWRAGRKTVLFYTSPRIFMHVPARIAESGFPYEELKAALARELGPPVW